MNSRFMCLAGLVLALIMFTSGAMACDVTMDEFDVEVRSDYDHSYADNVNAVDGDEIDIRIEIMVGTATDGSYTCGTGTVYADVYQYDGSSYDYWITAGTYDLPLTDDTGGTITWEDAFAVEDTYPRYQVRARYEDGNQEFSSQNSTIYMELGDCDDIVLTAKNYSIDEGGDQTKTFKIENNSELDFEVSSVDITINPTYLTLNSIIYSDVVDADETEDVEIEIEADTVGEDMEIEGTFRVSGYLGSTYCSASDIGSETFTVTIDNTSSDDDDDDDTSAPECGELGITANDVTVGEGKEKNVSFYLTNDSTKRFEILDVETSDNGVDIKTQFFEQYAFSGEVADVILEIDAPNVSSNKVYENYIKIRGVFSDGTECEYDDIGEDTFDVSVNNTVGFQSAMCENLIIEVPERVSVENFGTIPFTITNGTEKRADIIFESSLDVNPTLISLPENTSLSREVSVTIASSEGEILVKPQVDGCNYASQKIIVENTARGSLEDVAMEIRVEEDEEGKKLVIEFDNPTNKAFSGELSLELPGGWNAENRIITVSPGKTIAEVRLSEEEGAVPGTGTARFASDGEEVTQDFSTDSGTAYAAGLFALGEGAILGLVLLVALILIVALIYQSGLYKTKDEEQELDKWEGKKE